MCHKVSNLKKKKEKNVEAKIMLMQGAKNFSQRKKERKLILAFSKK